MAQHVLRRILMAEDDADIRAVARLALEALGKFEVALCESGLLALERAPTFAPDLILLDVMMPSMDGPTTLARLRSQPATSTTPVVFLTAKTQLHEIAYYRALGALDVIAKPFDPTTLPDAIKTIWARYHE